MAENRKHGFLVVDEKDWQELAPERRDWLIFNTLKSLDCRLETLERRPHIDKFYAFAGGILGGLVAALGIKFGQ